jgi:hydrogenase/urease accessory protein HupE
VRHVLVALIFLIPLLAAVPMHAHEIRPAYLEMRETAPDEFAIVWKVPALGEMRLGLHARLPGSCVERAEPVPTLEGGAYLERWTVACTGGLKGGEIGVDGLGSTMTDALVRIQYATGDAEVARLLPERPFFVAAGTQTSLEVAQTYFLLGVDHILSGLDHLLFVLALMLLIRGRWMLVKTITAFTVAHSITLAGASLGYFSLAQAPVEATIALSIAFVASELVKAKPGERRLSESYPWVVAFAFGLLHGFGFAGALKEIGLPESDVPLSLLAFNLGVEAGQLIFVAAALILLAAASALVKIPQAPARQVGAYAIGTAAMLWLIPRIAGLAA